MSRLRRESRRFAPMFTIRDSSDRRRRLSPASGWFSSPSRQAEHARYYVLHEGLIGVLGDQAFRNTLLHVEGAAARRAGDRGKLERHRRGFRRHHDNMAAAVVPDRAALPGQLHDARKRRQVYQPTCSATHADRARASARHEPPVRGAKRRDGGCLQDDSASKLDLSSIGLVLVMTSRSLGARLFYAVREFRRRPSDRHGVDQVPFLPPPTRSTVHGQDEGRAADMLAIRERYADDKRAAAAMMELYKKRRSSFRRLLPVLIQNPGLLRALQGCSHHRDLHAPSSLNPRPRRPRPKLIFNPSVSSLCPPQCP